MDGISQYQGGIQALAARISRRNAVHFITPRLWWLGMDEADSSLFDVGGGRRDLLGAQQVNSSKRDGEVQCGEDDVHSEGIPSIGFNEVFQPLRKGSVWR